VKYVPEWFPGATFQKKARKWRVHITGMKEKPYEAAKHIYVDVRLESDKDTLTFSPSLSGRGPLCAVIHDFMA